MNPNLKDILSHLNPDINQETLLQYIQGHLPAEKQQELEAYLIDNDFENDALEGLHEFKNKRTLSLMVAQLNRDLKKKTGRRKSSRALQLKSEPWLWVAVLIVLILVVISYIVIRSYHR